MFPFNVLCSHDGYLDVQIVIEGNATLQGSKFIPDMRSLHSKAWYALSSLQSFTMPHPSIIAYVYIPSMIYTE
jgi:hypothetical protein